MKALKLCLAAALAASLLLTGCTNRNNNNTSTPNITSSIPDIISQAEDGLEDFVSDWNDEGSGLNDRDDLSGYDNDESLRDRDNDGILDDNDQSIAAVMSTDFSEIGALDAEKFAWGSGGPTDDSGRPDGATLYQGKYEKYGAYFIAPSSQNVYLTFDEGYENGYTPAILDTLKEKDAKAVFFITLDFAKTQPELVRRMIDEGHILGNHSFKHLSFPEMPLREAAEDILVLHNYMKENYNYEMNLFRPPMGEFSEQSLALAQALGYKSIFWSFAYKDYDLDNQPLTIEALNTITSKCHPGAIYLLHAVSKTNAEVLGEVIDNIREQGYTIAEWDVA